MGEKSTGGEQSGASAGASGDLVAPFDFAARAKLPFPVVGIGASAGGVEALRSFFAATSATSGAAYVIIQHLSPEHQSLMAEILGRCTPMAVRQIEEGMSVEPNHVYVIRPGRTVTLEGGKLRLGEPVEKRGHRRPVDDFFRSLAREQNEQAIAVVLSGTGTNGSAGAQAIKAVGGLCIAQDPETADFPGMPQSLIHTGYADQVLKIEQIPPAIFQYAQHPYVQFNAAGRARALEELARHRQQLSAIIDTVRAHTGHDFASYKPPTLIRRIQRRVGILGLADVDEYSNYLRGKPAEVATLANDMMINVTGFFRDAAAWEALREVVVRPLVEQRAMREPIRAWVTACASGEEPYSLAMLIAEETERAGKKLDVKIFATDTADKSLSLARAGIYPGGIEGDLSPERLERFFEKDDQTYHIRKELRDQVVFAPQDLLRDPPFSHVDIATCRNLLIYLEVEAQRRALALLHFALRDGGHLFLGNAETLGHAEALFEVISKRWRIYRRSGPVQHRFAQLPDLGSRRPTAHPSARIAPTAIARPSATAVIESQLLEAFAPPTAVVDANERIIYFHGDAAPYLQPPSGEISQHLLEMVRPQLRAAVRDALRTAVTERRAVTAEAETAGEAGTITVTAAPLRHRGTPMHFRVTFVPSAQRHAIGAGVAKEPPGPRARSAEPDAALEEEVRALRRELQASIEAFETSTEELTASNEETASVNEELQSANEELETGHEELQSLNEELRTVNGQLQSKLVELEALTSDLDNLLSSTDIAVVFLDTQLQVRRFTPAVRDLLELIPSDIGRPLADLAQKFDGGGDLIAEAGEVIAKLQPRDSEVLSNSGRWYQRRTLPYRAEDGRVSGVVITFVEITARKHAEQAIGTAQARLQAMIEQMPAAVLMAEAPTGALLFANRRAASLCSQPFPLPYLGHSWTATYASLHGLRPDGRPYELHEWPLARALTAGETVLDEELDFSGPDEMRRTFSMSAAPMLGADGAVVGAVAAFWDITERKRAEAALRDSEERFRTLVESAHDYAIFMLDACGCIVSWNRGAERVTGYTEQQILGQSGALLFTPEDQAAGLHEAELRRASELGRVLDERWHVRKDGSHFWASGVVTMACDDDGTPRGFVKIIRDQSERKVADAHLQEALQSAQQLRARAEGANRAKDEFISTVSHELRTPLNTIRLWSRMFMSGKLHDNDVIEGAKMVDRAALAQQQLIEDLLDVSRMASGKLRLKLRDTALLQAVASAIEAVRPLAASRQITLAADLSPEVGTVRADPERMRQVVWNLLANAVKFSSDGGRIDVKMLRVDGSVEIKVRDHGVGIRADFLPHVFDRFRQGDASSARRYGGLGLGLAIAKHLVELHGGTITARSAGEGRGATFTVYLPLEKGEAPAHEDEPVGDVRATSDLRGIEVLLVDDETLGREVMQRLLAEYGMQVRAVDSAARAREAFEIRRPDLIMADIGMPDEDGYSLLASLRHMEQEQGSVRVPAVAVTAFTRSEDRQRALAAGFDDHLQKPVDPERLIAVIAKLAHKDKHRSKLP